MEPRAPAGCRAALGTGDRPPSTSRPSDGPRHGGRRLRVGAASARHGGGCARRGLAAAADPTRPRPDAPRPHRACGRRRPRRARDRRGPRHNTHRPIGRPPPRGGVLGSAAKTPLDAAGSVWPPAVWVIPPTATRNATTGGRQAAAPHVRRRGERRPVDAHARAVGGREGGMAADEQSEVVAKRRAPACRARSRRGAHAWRPPRAPPRPPSRRQKTLAVAAWTRMPPSLSASLVADAAAMAATTCTSALRTGACGTSSVHRHHPAQEARPRAAPPIVGAFRGWRGWQVIVAPAAACAGD